MTIIHSSDLGWTAGQDISNDFAALAKTFKPGDTFVFDHMYEISGSEIQLPDDFTLAGGAPGAGVDVVDTASNSDTLFFLGDGNTLVDLTVTHSSAPDTDTSSRNPERGVDFHTKITFVSEGDNVSVLNSAFSGNVSMFIDFRGTDNVLIEDSEFNGGNQQIRMGGSVDSPVVHNSVFQNALSDGIKTVAGDNSSGVTNATVSNSVFLNNGRDGIDTTGGFKDSVVTNSYFIDNGVSGMDIKEIYDTADDFASGGPLSENILITNSEFVDNNTAVVVTTLDRYDGLTTKNATTWAAQGIHIESSIVENNSELYPKKMFNVKDSFDVHWVDVTLLGDIELVRETTAFNTGLPIDVNGTVEATGDPRGQQPDSYYQSLAGPEWSNISYPTDGTATPVEPVVEPDPISYTPPVDPGPVAETPVVSASDLLDIFVAYTDTDETLSQLGATSSIDSSLTEGRSLTIYATSSGSGAGIGSVKVSVEGFGSRMENVAPYALFGDDGNGDFFDGKQFSEGTYTAEFVVYSGESGSGEVLESFSLDFAVDSAASEPVVMLPEPVVVDPVIETPVEADPEPVAETPADPVVEPVQVVVQETDLAPDVIAQGPVSQLLDVKFFDTSTDEALFELNDGTKLSSDDLAGRKITLSAEGINSDISIGSVRLEMDGKYSKVENVEPYALFGDNAKGDFKGGIEILDGMHSLTLTAYSGKNGKGSVLDQVTVNFEVGEYDSVLVDGSPSLISSYSAIQDTGTAKVSDDQSSIELEGSAWKSLDLSGDITEETILTFDFESNAEGEIQGIGFINADGELESKFFQLDGSQELGIQDFNDTYETGSGFKSYVIPVGDYFTGSAEQLVLVNDDDADLGSMSTFSNIGLTDGIA